MALVYGGSLPCSSVNLGIAASLSGFAQLSAQITVDVTKLGVALTTQIDFVSNFPPNIAGYAAGFADILVPATLVAAFNPANWVTLNADANLQLVAELGLVDLKIAVVGGLVAELEAGVNAGGLTGWSYAGRAAGFGTTLVGETRYGFAGTAPDADIDAIIIACADFDAWVSFSAGFNTGASASTDLGVETGAEQLTSMGTLTGGEWNTGALSVFAQLDDFLLELNGVRAGLDAQVELSLGLNLPSVSAVLDVALSIDLDATLAAMVSIQLDITAQIGLVELNLQAVADLLAELNAQLAVDGLHIWTYSGQAGYLGTSLASELSGGLPGGNGPHAPIYGVVIACASPSAWASFGNIMITG